MDDPWFDEMNPILKQIYYYSFIEDLNQKNESARENAIFLGSFTNMEMAQKLISQANPDYESSDKDFDESTKMVLDSREKHFNEIKKKNKKRRKRRVLNG